MRVGILTFHYAYNYGAVLQVYCLQQALVRMGFEVSILDYRAPAILSHNRPFGLRSGRFMYVLPMRLRFDAFRKDSLRLTRRLKNYADIEKEAKQYDALIVGSDQVWNTKILKGVNLAYFLGFPGSYAKISYAACFGQREQLEGTYHQIAELLKNFDVISVRDETSRCLVTELTGLAPSLVVDPTLLDACTDVQDKTGIHHDPYILVYSIWPQAEQTILVKIAEKIKKTCGYPVLSISQMWDFAKADKHIRTAGPAQWVQAFKDSAFVCTDSFHGVMYSVKYHKPFVAAAMNERSFRISEFLDRYGLRDRLVDTKGLEDNPALYRDAINYDHVYSTLSKDIKFSIDFIQQAIYRKVHDNFST